MPAVEPVTSARWPFSATSIDASSEFCEPAILRYRRTAGIQSSRRSRFDTSPPTAPMSSLTQSGAPPIPRCLPTRQHELADRAAGLELALRRAQIRGVDRAERPRPGRVQAAGVDERGDTIEDFVLARDVRRAEHRAREHEFPVDADALVLQ